jgi:acyl-CoA hydrolase
MDIMTSYSQHLVKGEDLNHHGTLYAGRTAEWFVEAGFVAAARLVPPEHIVCLKIHGMTFTSPIRKGGVVTFESKIVLTGKSRMVAFIEVKIEDRSVVRGFITFINVDMEGKSQPHGIEIVARTPEEIALQKEAAALYSSNH